MNTVGGHSTIFTKHARQAFSYTDVTCTQQLCASAFSYI